MTSTDSAFFVDREPDELNEEVRVVSLPENPTDGALVSGQQSKQGAKPVWVDDDDGKLEVNLLNVPRRKKLRKTLGEDKITATEYAKRIQEFYGNENMARGTVGGWAQLPSQKKDKNADISDDESSGDEDMSESERDLAENVRSLLRTTGSLLTKRKRAQAAMGISNGPPVLPKKVLDIQLLKHANYGDRCEAEARCVQFHPSGRLLLTAGLDKTLRIYQIEGKHSTKIQSLHVNRFPIYGAKFAGGGNEVILTSRRRFFYQLDMESGRASVIRTLSNHEEKSWESFEVSADGSKLGFLGQHGKAVIVDNKSKREIGQLRHNGRVACLAFAPLGESEHYVYSSTVQGTIRLWDVRTMGCVDAHKDEGAIHVTSLAVSNSHYAVGSDSGILNVYPSGRLGKSGGNMFGIRTESPVKAFKNLTTDIDDVKFNCDGQLMAFSSHEKSNAIRIAHTPSMTVFTNWPSSKTYVRRSCCLAFSPNSGYLAVGNDKGDVHLIRIMAYPAS